MMMSKETTGCRNQFSSEVGAALHLQLQIDTAAHPCAPTERKNVRIAYLQHNLIYSEQSNQNLTRHLKSLVEQS